ncbi:MAG: hypothetical protein JW937_10035, partial [Candidatus Omnitrophica bacterium]|nr:hypothetical protein [Candidatus Omnitrophota bacterium]
MKDYSRFLIRLGQAVGFLLKGVYYLSFAAVILVVGIAAYRYIRAEDQPADLQALHRTQEIEGEHQRLLAERQALTQQRAEAPFSPPEPAPGLLLPPPELKVLSLGTVPVGFTAPSGSLDKTLQNSFARLTTEERLKLEEEGLQVLNNLGQWLQEHGEKLEQIRQSQVYKNHPKLVDKVLEELDPKSLVSLTRNLVEFDSPYRVWLMGKEGEDPLWWVRDPETGQRRWALIYRTEWEAERGETERRNIYVKRAGFVADPSEIHNEKLRDAQYALLLEPVLRYIMEELEHREKSAHGAIAQSMAHWLAPQAYEWVQEKANKGLLNDCLHLIETLPGLEEKERQELSRQTKEECAPKASAL